MHSLSHRHLKHTDGKTIRKINLFYDGFSNFFSFLFYDFFFCSSFFFSLYSLSSREEALFLYINFPNQYFFHPTLLCHIFHSSSFRFSLLSILLISSTHVRWDALHFTFRTIKHFPPLQKLAIKPEELQCVLSFAIFGKDERDFMFPAFPAAEKRG